MDAGILNPILFRQANRRGKQNDIVRAVSDTIWPVQILWRGGNCEYYKICEAIGQHTFAAGGPLDALLTSNDNAACETLPSAGTCPLVACEAFCGIPAPARYALQRAPCHQDINASVEERTAWHRELI